MRIVEDLCGYEDECEDTRTLRGGTPISQRLFQGPEPSVWELAYPAVRPYKMERRSNRKSIMIFFEDGQSDSW